MTTSQVVETSVTVNNNSPIPDYVHPDDQTQPTFEMTPGFKPFTRKQLVQLFKNYPGQDNESKKKMLKRAGTKLGPGRLFHSHRENNQFYYVVSNKFGFIVITCCVCLIESLPGSLSAVGHDVRSSWSDLERTTLECFLLRKRHAVLLPRITVAFRT